MSASAPTFCFAPTRTEKMRTWYTILAVTLWAAGANSIPIGGDPIFPSLPPFPTRFPSRFPTRQPTQFPTRHPSTPSPTPCANDYVCPENSHRTPGVDCYDGFEDCTCDEGFENHYGACRFCDFECPENSQPDPHLYCHESFEDCKCDPLHVKEDGACVYFCDYTCLPNSHRDPDKTCWNNWQ